MTISEPRVAVSTATRSARPVQLSVSALTPVFNHVIVNAAVHGHHRATFAVTHLADGTGRNDSDLAD